jgi:hypothetical protein
MKKCTLSIGQTLRCFLLLLLFASFSYGLSSCASMKKTEKTTVAEIKRLVDTVIIFKHDTIPIKNEVDISRYNSTTNRIVHDTVTVENKTAIAKSYFNPAKQKIELSLQGKPFSEPIKISETTKVTTTEKDKTVTPIKHHWAVWICIAIVLCFWGYILIPYILKKK